MFLSDPTPFRVHVLPSRCVLFLCGNGCGTGRRRLVCESNWIWRDVGLMLAWLAWIDFGLLYCDDGSPYGLEFIFGYVDLARAVCDWLLKLVSVMGFLDSIRYWCLKLVLLWLAFGIADVFCRFCSYCAFLVYGWKFAGFGCGQMCIENRLLGL